MSKLEEVAKRLQDCFKNIDSLLGKCSSCDNKFNGTNGNGYQPCSCNVKVESPPPQDE